jgi:hypothetical protein
MTLNFTMCTTLFHGALAAILLLSAVGCGGGGAGSDDTPAPSSAVADAEAARLATLYRYTKGLGTLMLSGLSEVDLGTTRAGTRACTSGGTVTYTDTTPNPAGNPEAMISFDSCREAIGLIQGTMQVENLLIRLNADGSGTFNAAWIADVTINGYSMSFESVSGVVTRSATGAVQIETYGARDNALRLTAPDGRSVQFSDARIVASYDPATGLVDLSGTDVQMRSATTADLNAVLMAGGLTAPAGGASSGIVSVGLPQSGSLTYRRSFDETATDLSGTGTTSGGLLNLTIEPLPPRYRFPGSAGQYVWDTILANPDFALPRSSP